jgi:hypothetical protein
MYRHEYVNLDCVKRLSREILYVHRIVQEQIANTRRINPLKTKSRLLFLKAQSMPRCKRFSYRL